MGYMMKVKIKPKLYKRFNTCHYLIYNMLLEYIK